jgi:uncharacterized protein YidB (DUF937 family)
MSTEDIETEVEELAEAVGMDAEEMAKKISTAGSEWEDE